MIGYSRLDAWPDEPWDDDPSDDTNVWSKELKLEGDYYDDSKPE